MNVTTQTDYAKLPPRKPPTRTTLAAGDEFDPDSSEGIHFFCWCVGTLGDGLAPDTKRLLRKIRRRARRKAGDTGIDFAIDAARFDATQDVGGPIYSRSEFQATMLSVGAARIVIRFNEAIFGQRLETAPTLFHQLAELIFIHRTGEPIISPSEVEIIKAELRCIRVVFK